MYSHYFQAGLLPSSDQGDQFLSVMYSSSLDIFSHPYSYIEGRTGNHVSNTRTQCKFKNDKNEINPTNQTEQIKIIKKIC